MDQRHCLYLAKLALQCARIEDTRDEVRVWIEDKALLQHVLGGEVHKADVVVTGAVESPGGGRGERRGVRGGQSPAARTSGRRWIP